MQDILASRDIGAIMTKCSEFILHTIAFEQAFITDDWALLEPFYSADAVHTVVDGGPFEGEDIGPKAIAAGLGRGVNLVDRRFDVRIPQIIEGPIVRGDEIWMRFRLTFKRAGLPELNVEGEHSTIHRDGQIVEFREVLAPGHGDRAEKYLEEHDAGLRAANTPYSPIVTPTDQNDIDAALQAILVRCYGMAKGQQDIAAAMMLCHPDFVLETIPFRMASNNRTESQQQLAMFFSSFPDFFPQIEGLLAGEGQAACWGEVRMTQNGDLFGQAPSGKTAQLPFFSAFRFKDGFIAKETFSLDLAMLCDELELSLEPLLSVVRGFARTSDAGALHA